VKISNLAAGLCLCAASLAQGDDWRAEVSKAPPGDFARLPDVKMNFSFGWSNVLEAGQATAVIRQNATGYHAEVSGRSMGFARVLWPLDATHTATINAAPLRPVRSHQIERYRSRTIETEVRFDSTGLERQRKVTPSTSEAKWKRVNFEPIYDMLGGILYVRSQPLRVGDKIGVVCFPSDSPYLAVVTVEAKETILCMGKEFPSLRLSLQVRKLEVKKKVPTQAVDYEKFESGTVWVSDDALRLPLRAEVNVLVGYVYGELTGYEKL
jgi:Protein of unknown function (DUF3108)